MKSRNVLQVPAVAAIAVVALLPPLMMMQRPVTPTAVCAKDCPVQSATTGGWGIRSLLSVD
jgi:hypothetical protein